MAASVDGVTVAGAGSSTQIGLLESGKIKYFIPLSGSNDGVYGVSVVAGGIAGTFADWGSGYGYYDANDALQMYLRYDLASLDVPAATALLSFEFDDLDLVPVNDPSGFVEDIQFNYFDGTSLVSLTNTIKNVGDDPTLVDPNATITVDPTNDDHVTIDFPSLAPILNSLPAGSDAFYVRLDFSSDLLGSNCAKNTRELLVSAVLTTSPPPQPVIPLPAAAWMGLSLLGGMAGVGAIRRKLTRA